jgi:hypothetical protein
MANSSVDFVSPVASPPGAQHAINAVLAVPPNDAWSNRVSFESL